MTIYALILDGHVVYRAAMTNSAAAAPASSTSQSLLLRELPTTLPTVEYWRIHDEPLPRDIDEKVLIERYGFNDDAEDDWIQPPDYIRYAAPLEHQLLRQTEYTMDESDALWMDDFNADRVQGGRSQLQPLPYEYFEVVMDTIEKEWFALQARIPKVEEWTSAEDSQCAVCGDGECENSNAIVFCDGCNLAVHQGKSQVNCSDSRLLSDIFPHRLLWRAVHPRGTMAVQKMYCLARQACCLLSVSERIWRFQANN